MGQHPLSYSIRNSEQNGTEFPTVSASGVLFPCPGFPTLIKWDGLCWAARVWVGYRGFWNKSRIQERGGWGYGRTDGILLCLPKLPQSSLKLCLEESNYLLRNTLQNCPKCTLNYPSVPQCASGAQNVPSVPPRCAPCTLTELCEFQNFNTARFSSEVLCPKRGCLPMFNFPWSVWYQLQLLHL